MPAPLPAVNGSSSPGLSVTERSLLQSLESARDLLARGLTQEQIIVTGPDLNYTVISSILQVLFLKAGQECGFVKPGTLALLAQSDRIGMQMARACTDAGLSPEIFFDVGPDGSRPMPAIPDPALRELISHADSPEFTAPLSSLTPEECAVVFEHLLGMRLEVAEGYRVKKTGKSAVLYTGSVNVPDRKVVEYIVNGSLRENSRDDHADHRGIRILDPACGAGIFLLAAYRFLVRKGEPKGQPDTVCRSVFGTDIDPESVSAARFVLLLAFIDEDRVAGSIPVSAGRIREICTGLTKTIRCGNALIAPDYFSGKPVFPFNAEERRKVNAFDWETAFNKILDDGGFDIVLGAPPPYRPFSIQSREDYFQTYYDVYAPSAGLFCNFIEKGISLLRPGGTLAVLIPGTFLRSRYARPLRHFLLARQIEEITDTGRTRAIQGEGVRMYILRLRNQKPDRPFIVSTLGVAKLPRQVFSPVHGVTLDQRSFDDGGWILEDTRVADLLMKVRTAGTPLDRYLMGEINPGTHRIRNNPLVVDPETKARLTGKAWWCRRFFIPLLRPADIRRFVPEKPSWFVIFAKTRRDKRHCRELNRYLEEIVEQPCITFGKKELREISGSPELTFPIDPESGQNGPKIIFSSYQHSPAFCYDPKGSFAITNTLLSIPRNDPLLVAILNSSLGRFVITHTCPRTDRGYHVSPAHLGKFPMIATDFDKLAEKNRHDKIIALMTRIFSLHEYLQKTKTDQERRLVQQEIEATDVKIDALVYELYGLTAEDIAVVEESIVI